MVHGADSGSLLLLGRGALLNDYFLILAGTKGSGATARV
jgi:hypothetical protein